MGCRCTAVAETKVVFRGSPLVAMPFHIYAGIREVGEYPLQRIGIGRERGTRIIANVVRIVIEESVPEIRLNA